MGLIDMLLYQLVDRSSPTELLDKALEFLALLSDENSRSCSAKAQGKILPPVVCAWLSGQVALADAEAFLYGQHFEQHTPDEFFRSHREARLVKRLLQILATPEPFTASLRTIKQGLRLLEECAQQRTIDGSPSNTLYILSNWDPYSFRSMQEADHFQKLFAFFDHNKLIISGNRGYVKPHKEIYSYVLTTYGLAPSQCLLIDDQEENILGAQEIGMHGILLKEGNYDALRKELHQLNIIK
jgi:FMN phosphatase YigB (HAD superfamily)